MTGQQEAFLKTCENSYVVLSDLQKEELRETSLLYKVSIFG